MGKIANKQKSKGNVDYEFDIRQSKYYARFRRKDKLFTSPQEQMNKYGVSHMSSYIYPKAPKLSFVSAAKVICKIYEQLWIN